MDCSALDGPNEIEECFMVVSIETRVISGLGNMKFEPSEKDGWSEVSVSMDQWQSEISYYLAISL